MGGGAAGAVVAARLSEDPGAKAPGLLKKPWVFIRVLYMDPNILGFWDLGF